MRFIIDVIVVNAERIGMFSLLNKYVLFNTIENTKEENMNLLFGSIIEFLFVEKYEYIPIIIKKWRNYITGTEEED